MANQILCDGCNKVIKFKADLAIEGRRANGTCGGGLPDAEFHLCYDCSVAAFHAAVTRPSQIDTHKLAGEICDTKRAQRDEPKPAVL